MIVDDTIAKLNAKDLSNPLGLAQPANSACPNCGYCPHCGRGGYRTSPFWYPPFMYPYMNPYQWQPVTNPQITWTSTTTGTNTV